MYKHIKQLQGDLNKAIYNYNKREVYNLKKAGKSTKEIATSMDISKSRVYQLLKK